jgi:ApaG protein
MKGSYLMERVVDGKNFKVNIPEFVMVVPYKNN